MFSLLGPREIRIVLTKLVYYGGDIRRSLTMTKLLICH